MDSSPGRPSVSATADRIPAEINRLQLDLLARRACAVLRDAGLPHALIKGPTTSLWLYDPPRPYTDVDLLVPPSRRREAVAVLARAGVAQPTAGRFGEVAAHSQVLLTDRGFEVDLHGTLPTLMVDGRDPDRVWRVLAGQLEPFELASGWEPVPALTPAARGVVLALHALGCGLHDLRGMEDLRRARQSLGADGWRQARALAAALRVTDRFDAMDVALDDLPLPVVDRETALWLTGASGPAIQVARLRGQPFRRVVLILVQELLPSRDFMARAYPDLHGRRIWLPRAYLRRLLLAAAGRRLDRGNL